MVATTMVGTSPGYLSTLVSPWYGVMMASTLRWYITATLASVSLLVLAISRLQRWYNTHMYYIYTLGYTALGMYCGASDASMV